MNSGSQNNQRAENILHEDEAVYERQKMLEDDARLREAIGKTHAEKFRFLMTLMKMNNQMRRAIIHRK